jgi:hypothetical protein
MSAQPLGSPLFRALDSNGAPLAGGLLYTYAGGTSTPLATYTDQSGTVANANPVVLDATGSAQVWLAPGVLYKFVLQNSSGVQQWSVDNYPVPATTAQGNTQVSVNDPGGRLTFSPTLPVSTADLTSQVTAYYLPYKSDQVPLYNGSSWSLYSIGTGLSQALTDTLKSPAAAAANSCYDLFVWLDGSTVRLSRGPAWSNTTTRGTGAGTSQLSQVNGRYVNAQNITNGPAASLGLYVGTIYTDASSQGNDSLAKRNLWNNYNRVTRPMLVADPASSWVYVSSTLRQANGNGSNQLEFVAGQTEDEVCAETLTTVAYGSAQANGLSGIGVDSTSTASGTTGYSTVGPSNTYAQLTAKYRGTPGLGRHFLTWLEASGGTGTTFNGTQGLGKSGISGEVRA